jgi:hypothetical protein
MTLDTTNNRETIYMKSNFEISEAQWLRREIEKFLMLILISISILAEHATNAITDRSIIDKLLNCCFSWKNSKPASLRRYGDFVTNLMKNFSSFVSSSVI